MSIQLTWLLVFLSPLWYAQAWLQITDFPGLERDDGVAVVVNNKAYFGTGLPSSGPLGSDFYALDLTTQSWSPIASMPASAGRQYAMAFAGPGSFYVLAGDLGSSFTTSMYQYDIATNTWTAKTAMPGNGLMGSCSMAFGDKIIVVGGKFQNNKVNNKVWQYSIAADSWTQKNDFPFGGRWRGNAAVLNNTGYFLFGVDSLNHLRRELYAYDQPTDTWTKVSDFPWPGRAYAALQNTSTTLIAFGGLDSIDVYQTDVWEFNPALNNWSRHQSLPSFGRKGGMSVCSGNTFYYSCGVTHTERVKQTWMTDVPVGIEENTAPVLITVFPNPATAVLYVSGATNAELSNVMLLDVCGRAVTATISGDQKNNRLQVDMHNLETGVYVLKIKSKDATVFKKIVKE